MMMSMSELIAELTLRNKKIREQDNIIRDLKERITHLEQVLARRQSFHAVHPTGDDVA